jgi:uncharacterized cupin superfamily protein
VRKINVAAPEFDHSSARDGYRWRGARVGRALGAEEIGACLYELEDGQASYPYHFHHAMEEWLVVIAGAPTVRARGDERVLREGDVLCFPPGPEGGHQVTGPGTVLILSDNRAPESVEYPDSGKIGVSAGKIFRLADAVDLWDGE